MNALLDAGLEVSAWLKTHDISACVIGGLAVQRWGEPRLTLDVDLTLLAPYGSEEEVVDACLKRFSARIQDARTFALNHRVLLLKASNGVDLDLALGATEFEAEAIEHASDYEFATGYVLRTCSADDLIVHKLVAGRPQDLIDVEGIIRRQWRAIDLDRVRRWLRIFAELKEDPGMLTGFEALLKMAQKNRPD
jgi:Nucleotidyl transferase AbiEii toxin, Type IV TA system